MSAGLLLVVGYIAVVLVATWMVLDERAGRADAWDRHLAEVPDLVDHTTDTGDGAYVPRHAGPELDHDECQHPECDRIICLDDFGPNAGPCEGTVEQACGHYQLLCDEHAIYECHDCLTEYRDDLDQRLARDQQGGW